MMSCFGAGRQWLVDECMKLPTERCLPSMPEKGMNGSRCDDEDFDCGDGQCISYGRVCDNQFECRNGADELGW